METYEYGDDGSFIQLTLLDHASFNNLLAVFKRFYHFNWHSGNGGGLSSLKTKNEVLGLVLMFFTSVIEYKSLYGHWYLSCYFIKNLT